MCVCGTGGVIGRPDGMYTIQMWATSGIALLHTFVFFNLAHRLIKNLNDSMSHCYDYNSNSKYGFISFVMVCFIVQIYLNLPRRHVKNTNNNKTQQ